MAANLLGMAGIQTAGNFINSIFGNKQRQKMADLQYQRSIKDRDNEREYMSPKQQMARFKEAGLNPHLIYGQGTQASAGAQPSYQAPDIETPKIEGLPEAAGTMGKLGNQARGLDIQDKQFQQYAISESFNNALKQAQTDRTKIQAAGDQFTLDKNNATYQQQVDKIWTESAIAEQTLANQRLEAQGIKARTDATQTDTKFKKDTMNVRVAQETQKLIGQVTDNSKKQQEIKNLLSSKKLIDANTNQANTKTILNTQELLIKQGVSKQQAEDLAKSQMENELLEQGITPNMAIWDIVFRADWKLGNK